MWSTLAKCTVIQHYQCTKNVGTFLALLKPTLKLCLDFQILKCKIYRIKRTENPIKNLRTQNPKEDPKKDPITQDLKEKPITEYPKEHPI